MDWERFAQTIENQFATLKVSVGSGQVLIPEEPLNLREALAEVAENEDEVSFIECMGVLDALEEGLPTHRLLDFHWEGLGATSSFAGLKTVELGPTGTLVCWLSEIPPEVGLALLRPSNRTAVCSAFFLDLVSDNGQSYGTGLFGDLPSRTRNWQGDLLPSYAVKEAYRRWLDWRDTERPGRGWAALRDSVIERLEQPNPLIRSSALMEKLATLGPDGFLEETRSEPVELTDTDRSVILENFFDLTYTETNQNGRHSRHP